MRAPLSRDQQIALMKTAEERHEAQMTTRLAHIEVRDALRRPPAGLEVGYHSRTVKVACCG